MTARMVVALCTQRRAAAVAGALDALRRQTDELAIVLSGLSASAVAEHRAALGRDPLVEPRPGLSRARNHALEWAAQAGADVIAYVDDDAIVEAGWYDALLRRWSEAPADVACIGGPIWPSYAIAPPAWMSDGISHALTLLDRGREVRDLDPRAEAVYGANISFRVGALREIGGFDTRLGHAGRRIFFAEEDEAERELFRRGYRVRYVPDAAVRHVIGAERLRRRSFLQRRFAFGVALGMRGGRTASLATRQALRTGAGALAAAITGDDAVAMERAVRAAENAGVLRGLARARRAPRR